jgi:hypothetical protein
MKKLNHLKLLLLVLGANLFAGVCFAQDAPFRDDRDSFQFERDSFRFERDQRDRELARDVISFYRTLSPTAKDRFRTLPRKAQLVVVLVARDPSLLVHHLFKENLRERVIKHFFEERCGWEELRGPEEHEREGRLPRYISEEVRDFYQSLSPEAQKEFRLLGRRHQWIAYTLSNDHNTLVHLIWKISAIYHAIEAE